MDKAASQTPKWASKNRSTGINDQIPREAEPEEEPGNSAEAEAAEVAQEEAPREAHEVSAADAAAKSSPSSGCAPTSPNYEANLPAQARRKP